MKDILIKDLYLPDYYMEIKGHDIRIGIKKFDDLLKTIGDANFSLLYSDKNEHKETKGIELSIVRRMHIRHAILDFNNSFDILMQIPWFFYRVWEEYNNGNSLYSSTSKHKDIIRNTDGWATKAGKYCNFNRLHMYLKDSSNQKLNKFDTKLKDFYNTFISNKTKKLTIRSLANMIKHNSALQLKELNEPWELNIKIDKIDISSLKEKGFGAVFNGSFGDLSTGKTEGAFKVLYTDDIYLDIEYSNGEMFRATDYMYLENLYTIDEIRDECIDFNDKLIVLYNELFSILEDDLSINILFKPEGLKSAESINLDKYFKSE